MPVLYGPRSAVLNWFCTVPDCAPVELAQVLFSPFLKTPRGIFFLVPAVLPSSQRYSPLLVCSLRYNVSGSDLITNCCTQLQPHPVFNLVQIQECSGCLQSPIAPRSLLWSAVQLYIDSSPGFWYMLGECCTTELQTQPY